MSDEHKPIKNPIQDLGAEVARMIGDVLEAKAKFGGVAYGRRTITIRGGKTVELLICSDRSLADLMEGAAATVLDVQDSTPGSKVN